MKKTTARPAAKKAAASKTAAAKPKPAASKNILSAGIKALSNAHEEALARQSRVFETLLGIGSKGPDAERKEERANAAPNALTAALDPFGFRKFEDVFDQRVARSLANLQAPTAEAFAALKAEVEDLRAAVAALQSQAKKR